MEIISIIVSIPLIIELLCSVFLMMIFLFCWKPEKIVDDLPLVTIFVPFYNEDENLLLTALSKIEEQDYPSKLQVLIIDDGSTNDTVVGVKKWLEGNRKHEFCLINKPQNSGRKGAALDYALSTQQARGDVYIVVDSDTFIEPNGILSLASKIWSHPEYAAVCGYVVPKNREQNMLCRSQFYEHIGVHGALRTSQDQLGVVPVLAGAFVAHRASVVKELGGWGEWLVEDIAWCWKALANRYRTGYTTQAVARTQCPESNDELFRQRRRWSRGRVEAFWETWKVSPTTGVASLPWFLVSATEFLYPPLFIAIPIFAFFGMWLPLSTMLLALLIESIFIFTFIKRTGNSQQLTKYEIALLPLFTHLLRFITWVPNILGYLDEVMRKDKKWLTR